MHFLLSYFLCLFFCCVSVCWFVFCMVVVFLVFSGFCLRFCVFCFGFWWLVLSLLRFGASLVFLWACLVCFCLWFGWSWWFYVFIRRCWVWGFCICCWALCFVLGLWFLRLLGSFVLGFVLFRFLLVRKVFVMFCFFVCLLLCCYFVTVWWGLGFGVVGGVFFFLWLFFFSCAVDVLIL